MAPLRFVGTVVCLAVIVAYFYTPVPEGMNSDDQWQMRKLYALIQTDKLVSRLGALVGYDTALNISRSLRSFGLAFTDAGRSEIVSADYEFDGISVTVHEKKKWKTEKIRRAAIFYIHGGGWVYETRDIHANLERYFSEQLDIVVVSVHYPLAPEHPYPVPFEACLKAIKHFHRNAEEFGVDPKKISIAGDSAGGNLAAAVTLKLRDEGNSFLYRQILIAPALQFASFRLEAFEENDRYAVLTRHNVVAFWLHYMNQSAEFINDLTANEHVSSNIMNGKAWSFLQKYQKFPQDHVKVDEKLVSHWETKILDPYLCPLFADSLKNLPPTLILATEYDVLRDEALAYADRLTAEGVETTVVKPLGFHGIYCLLKESPIGMQMANAIVNYLRDALVVGNKL